MQNINLRSFIFNKPNWLKILLSVAILSGIYFRLKGLGTWPLAVDEYYFIKSVENILKFGIPQFEHGGYYPRGILQQYLTAGNLLLGFSTEFGARIIPIIFNLLALPVLYKIGKKISGTTLATILVVVFSLSVWEVEMARFARMYAPFQTIFIWYIYFLFKAVIEKDEKSRKWIWIISFVSLFVYEASIFLILLNLISATWDKERETINLFSISIYKKNAPEIIISFLLLIVAYFYLTTNFRTLGQENLFPPEMVVYFKSQIASHGTFRKPILLLQFLGNYTLWPILYSLLVIINFYLFFKIKKFEISILTKFSISVLLLLSVLNLFGLLLVTFVLFFLLGWIRPDNFIVRSTFRIGRVLLKYKPTKLFLLLMVCWISNFFFWILFSIKTTDWHIFFPNENIVSAASSIKVSLKYFLNYPNFYETFVLFRETIPLLTVITILLIVFLVIRTFLNFNESETKKNRFLLFVLLFLVLFIGLLDLKYFDTRYFFFVYPLIIILSIFSIETIANLISKNKRIQHISFGVFIILVLYLSEDFSLYHLSKIDSYDLNFRVNQNLALKKHYYPRWDVRTPAEFVNAKASQTDIIISNEQINEYYLERLDYVYIDYRGKMYQVSVENGTLERWTNANLIYKYDQLVKTIEEQKNNNTWIIINTLWGKRFFDEVDFFNKFQKYSVFSNPDSSAIVYKIPGDFENSNR